MERQKIGWKPIVLYVFAIIFAVYSIYSLVSTAQYIGQMVAAQYIVVSESLSQIIAYFVTNVGAYIFYALVMAAFAYIIDVKERGLAPKKEKTAKASKKKKEAKASSKEKEEDEKTDASDEKKSEKDSDAETEDKE